MGRFTINDKVKICWNYINLTDNYSWDDKCETVKRSKYSSDWYLPPVENIHNCFVCDIFTYQIINIKNGYADIRLLMDYDTNKKDIIISTSYPPKGIHIDLFYCRSIVPKIHQTNIFLSLFED